jgi:hypothetical protein
VKQPHPAVGGVVHARHRLRQRSRAADGAPGWELLTGLRPSHSRLPGPAHLSNDEQVTEKVLERFDTGRSCRAAQLVNRLRTDRDGEPEARRFGTAVTTN